MVISDLTEEEKTQLINEIKTEFLALVKNKKTGYIISLEQLYNWLGNQEIYEKYKFDKDFRKYYLRDYLRNTKYILQESKDENDLTKDFIMKRGETGQTMYPWFSTEGFKKYCMVLDLPKANFIRLYYLQLEEDYMRVLEQTVEQNKIELDALHENIKKLEFDLEKKAKELEKKDEEHKEELKHYVSNNSELTKKLNSYFKLNETLKYREEFAETGSDEYKMLEYFKIKYMKKAEIYLVNPEYMTKKSDENADVIREYKDEYDDVKKYDEFTRWDVEYDGNWHETEMYYYIRGLKSSAVPKAKNFQLVGDIMVLSADHLTKIKKNLYEMEYPTNFITNKTDKKDIYRTTYSMILSSCNETLSNMLYELKKKEIGIMVDEE